MASSLKKVAIIGSGNWGSAIARLVGRNAARKIFIMVIRSTPFLEVAMVVLYPIPTHNTIRLYNNLLPTKKVNLNSL